ncbi:hypothetical protein [Halorubrum sp. JWXQ-INN 858]|uniref:hypothetical protein n=1 Tax=Halorubrum sp. JWXQ-INN 858 TaxID=2690782 RepID=UPI001F23CA83|nr:hypothetical protein [Halorubrum sp. JWXQ-INN 858]
MTLVRIVPVIILVITLTITLLASVVDVVIPVVVVAVAAFLGPVAVGGFRASEPLSFTLKTADATARTLFIRRPVARRTAVLFHSACLSVVRGSGEAPIE